MNISELTAGAASVDVTPESSAFLHGYPHVPRMSTGTHDPLLACALFLEHDGQACMFLAVDLLLVDKAFVRRVRERIAAETTLKPGHILLSATHTHSGPVTVSVLSNESDSVVPPPDPAVVAAIEDAVVQAGVRAWTQRRPAEAAFRQARADGIGTARHDPNGPSDLNVPILAVRAKNGGPFIGVLMVCAMHPTVLHEDSTLFSGDFPAFARQTIQRDLTGDACPIVYHTGVSGDQSPRHVTKGNTFPEAERIGGILGRAVVRALTDAEYHADWPIQVVTDEVALPARIPPTVVDASAQVDVAVRRLTALGQSNASRTDIRTAECDWFGAEETLTLARAAVDGRLVKTLASISPAEIQVIRVGDRSFVGWPGEFFIEFGLRVQQAYPNASIITLANGDLQGYVVTQKAVDNRWYEAGNALLQSPDSGDIVVAATCQLLKTVEDVPHA